MLIKYFEKINYANFVLKILLEYNTRFLRYVDLRSQIFVLLNNTNLKIFKNSKEKSKLLNFFLTIENFVYHTTKIY